MTAEEAIATLKANYPDACYEQLREAVDMAIAALEQPTITHEQAIDYLHKTGWLQNHDRILTESKIVPPVHGEWIDTETSYADGVQQKCRCSVCKLLSPRPLGDFCRWCGADMRGGKDGTD